jgi:HEAT repeat protein
LENLYLSDKDPDTRLAILEEISRRPPHPASFLFSTTERALRDASSSVRAASAKVLVMAAPKLAVPALVKLLMDAKPQVWRAAIQAAEKLSTGEKDPLTRAEVATLDKPMAALIAKATAKDALEAVRMAGKLHLREALRQGTEHANGLVRAAAVEAIVPFMTPEEALPVLEAALREREPELRRVALNAIAQLSAHLGKNAIRLLWRGTRAEDPSERWAAFKALGQVRGQSLGHALTRIARAAHHPSEERRRLAMMALSELAQRDARAAESLAAGVDDPARDVRAEAMAGLSAYLGRFCPLPELWRILMQSSRQGVARRLAVAALAWHGRHHGSAGLEKLVSGLPPQTPIMTRIVGNLALALSRWNEPPERVIDWLYGW